MKKTIISACALMLALPGIAQKKKAPNILFLLADDLQRTSIHAYGNDQVISPNIDGIIDRGVSISNAYTNGSLCGALSMPSRAMLMTGRGVYQVVQDGQRIPDEHTTMPELFRQNGYTTYATGKWHSDRQSFNRSFGNGENIFFGGMHQYSTNGHVEPRLVHYDPTGEYKEKPFIGDKFSTEMFADAAIDFMKNRKKGDNPYFLYVAFTSPHDPRNQHPAYGPSYNPDTLDLPVNFLPQHPFDNGDMKVRDEVLLPHPRTEEAIRTDLAGYYGMISELDVQIGRILQTLKETGELENTIIVFASDNGLAVGRHGLLGKQNLYEHSIGVPLVFVAPDLEKGVTRDAQCYLYDIYPTLCEMTGITPATSVTGKSLLPTLKKGKKHRENLFLAYSSIQRSIVKDGWKYIVYNVEGTRHEQLFDLRNDPYEMVNHADNPAYSMKINAYKRILKEEMKRNGDFCDLDDHFWWGTGEMLPWNDALKLFTDPNRK